MDDPAAKLWAADAYCAKCGYPLRGLTAARCPECGATLAAQREVVGEIPWPYRAFRGRARAFIRTAWDVLAGAAWAKFFASAPIAVRDARRFWLAAAIAISVPLLAMFFVVTRGGLDGLLHVPDALQAGMPRTPGGGPMLPAWWTNSAIGRWSGLSQLPPAVAWMESDVVWPLSVGWSRPGVGPMAIVLAALLGSGAAAYTFHPRSIDEPRRRRLAAFGYYLIGATLAAAAVPLTLALAAGLWWFEYGSRTRGSVVIAAFLGGVATLLTVALGYARMLGATRAVTRGRLAPTVVFALAVPAWIVAGTTFALVVIPWTIGYAWLLVDAL